MLELKRMSMTRIVASPAALDEADFGDNLSFRVAADEVYVMADISPNAIADAHAIFSYEASLAGLWLSARDGLHFLDHECPFELPKFGPAFVQGMIAHLPVKLYIEGEQMLIMTPAPFAHELGHKIREVLA